MALWIKCLPCKGKGLSSNPQHPCKCLVGMAATTYNPSNMDSETEDPLSILGRDASQSECSLGSAGDHASTNKMENS